MTNTRRELNLRLLGFEASARPLWCQLEILNRQFFPQRCCINAKVPSGRILVLNRRSKRIISIRHQLINLICHCHFSRAATKSVFLAKKEMLLQKKASLLAKWTWRSVLLWTAKRTLELPERSPKRSKNEAIFFSFQILKFFGRESGSKNRNDQEEGKSGFFQTCFFF